MLAFVENWPRNNELTALNRLNKVRTRPQDEAAGRQGDPQKNIHTEKICLA